MAKAALTAGQRAYEAKRAAKAGVSLEKWLASKDKEAAAEARVRAKAAEPAKPVKPPGLLKRMIDRAHQPLKADPKAAAPKVQARTGGRKK